MRKKFLSLLVAIALVLPVFCISPLSANAESLTGQCGDNVTWEYDITTGVLIISGTGEMTGCGWYNPYRLQIKEVIISNNVTNIVSNAFYYSKNLKKVINYSSLNLVAGSTDNGYVAYYAKNAFNFILGDIDSDNTLTNADITGDGKINNRDAIALIRKLNEV